MVDHIAHKCSIACDCHWEICLIYHYHYLVVFRIKFLLVFVLCSGILVIYMYAPAFTRTY